MKNYMLSVAESTDSEGHTTKIVNASVTPGDAKSLDYSTLSPSQKAAVDAAIATIQDLVK
jgi:hypothetical protein